MSIRRSRDVSVDEIMQKIREVVGPRKAPAGDESFDDGGLPFPGEGEPSPAHDQGTDTRIWRLLKAVQKRLVSYAFYPSLLGFARRIKKYIPEKKSDALLVRDLLTFHDEDFLRNAYEKILLRAPDPDGLNAYLTKLRSGALSKVDILGRLRYSKEGRTKRVRIKWLLPHVAMSLVYSVPVVGRLLRCIAAVFMPPALV